MKHLVFELSGRPTHHKNTNSRTKYSLLTSRMTTASLRSQLLPACRHHRWRNVRAPEPRDYDVTKPTRRRDGWSDRL